MGMRYVSIQQTIQVSICKIADIVNLHFELFWSAGNPTMHKLTPNGYVEII